MSDSLALFEETTTPVPARCCATCRWYTPQFGNSRTGGSGLCNWSPEKLPQVRREGRDGILPPAWVLETYGTRCETWKPE